MSRHFHRFTSFGWILMIVAFAVAGAMMLEIGSFRWFMAREPSVWRYGVEVVLFMLCIPLAYAAWKSSRRLVRHYIVERVLLGLWTLHALWFILESRIALEKGGVWRPHVPFLFLWASAFALFAWGRKPESDLGPFSAKQSKE